MSPDFDPLSDPRLTPARDDLAAAHLEDKLDAPRYVEGEARQASLNSLPLTLTPDPAAEMATELLFGERFTVYDTADGWAWGQAAADGYVGYVPAEALGPAGGAPTHHVSVLLSHIYPAPDLKSRPLMQIPMGAPLALQPGDAEKGFRELHSGGWVYAWHLTPVGQAWGAPLQVALRFLGAPYLWGGRTAAGIDCSGLVQIALMASGRACPRDTDMQAAGLPGYVTLPAHTPPEGGDIVYFPGHVGFMVDGQNLLHANATHMAVTIDPLAEVIEIIKTETDKPPVTCVMRVD